MSYKNQPTLPFFSHVVKNIASPNLEIKKLVYAYLVQHAEEAPDMALLSINTIQKALSDTDPHLRALALRTMSSIRVPVISQIVALGIKRAVGDMSPYVRRAAALAIPKCYGLNPDTLPLLVEQIGVLLGDRQYYVAGAAVMAFLEVCPERLDLVHPHYRNLIKKLVDMDEWGQLATMRLMMVYARKCFPRRTRRGRPAKGTRGKKDFYDDDSEDDTQDYTQGDDLYTLDPDLESLLNAGKSLLTSRNPAVTIAVARMYLYIGTPTHLTHIIGPLISLLRAGPDIQQVALHNIIQISLQHPHLLAPYASRFLLSAQDGPLIRDLKLELLTLVFPHSNSVARSLILSELSHFTHSSDGRLVRAAVEAIGRCAQSSTTPELSAQCLRLLLNQLSSSDAHLVASSLDVIRHLIQRDPAAHAKTIVRLAKSLDALTAPSARASIIWLVGEYASTDPEHGVAADVLRILVRGYAHEEDEVKAQIVLLAAKVYLQYLLANKKTPVPVTAPASAPATQGSETLNTDLIDSGGWNDTPSPTATTSEETAQAEHESTHPIPALYTHTLLLSRYTTSYDLRDRTRLYRSLLSTPTTSTDLASLLLLAPKPAPMAPSPSQARKGFQVGSASLVVGVQGVRGYEDLPAWVEEGEEPDPRLRDLGGPAEYVSTASSSSIGGGGSGGSAAAQLDAASARAGVVAPAAGRTNGHGAGLNKMVGPGKEKTLDDWLDEESEEDEESTEEEEEEEEEESGEEEESDEEGESEHETESEESEDDEKAGLVR
jgi:vesicle coat complex subunit